MSREPLSIQRQYAATYITASGDTIVEGNLRRVGVLYWNKNNPDSKMFSEEVLSQEDMDRGYFQKFVYVIT